MELEILVRRMKPFVKSLMLASSCVTSAWAQTGNEEKLASDLLTDRSSIVIASQQICGFDTDIGAIKDYVARTVPDMPWELFETQVRGYQRILVKLNDEEKNRHCASLRPLADSAVWVGPAVSEGK